MRLSLKSRAIVGLCIVAFSYALLSVSVRLLHEGFGDFTQVYLRIGLGCILTTIIFYQKFRFSRMLKISAKDWFFLLLMGSIGYGLSVDFATIGILQTKLLDVAVISSTTPFFIFLFSIVALRKTFRPYLIFFLLLAFYGVCVLSTKLLVPTFTQFNIGDFYVLLFAIGLGFYIFGRKMLSSALNNYEIAVIVMAIAFLCSLSVAVIEKERLDLTGFANPTALFGLLLGGILNLVATTIENFSFKHINAVVGSQLLLLENVFAPFFGFFLYHEFILPIEFMGASLVIAGVWLYVKYGED